jgi:hypothetical protein
MARTEIKSFHFRARTSTVQRDGDSYLVDTIVVNGVRIKVTYWDDAVVELSTDSKAYISDGGGRIGDTLITLQKLYSTGRVHVGSEEGAYFTFETGRNGQYFIFDARKIGRDCVIVNRNCPNLEKERTILLDVRE